MHKTSHFTLKRKSLRVCFCIKIITRKLVVVHNIPYSQSVLYKISFCVLCVNQNKKGNKKTKHIIKIKS